MADFTYVINPGTGTKSLQVRPETAVLVSITGNVTQAKVAASATPCQAVKVMNPSFDHTSAQQDHAIVVLINGVRAAQIAAGQSELFIVNDASIVGLLCADGNNAMDAYCRIIPQDTF